VAFVTLYWPWIAGSIGFLASAIGIYEFIQRVIVKKKPRIPEYKGLLDAECVHFIYEHESHIFKLSLQLSEEQSEKISSWIRNESNEPVIWLSVPHDEYGSEIGFHRNDNEIHWNTRFWSMVHTEGYFKVHSTQGPYQGWMSLSLRGVGVEHIAT